MTHTVPREWLRNASDELAVAEGCTFDPAKGARPCDFIERFCRQSKGRWAGKPIGLLPWQRDFLMRFFGWRRADGRRRFRRFYVEVAKKNGKTTLLAGLQLYLLMADDEGPEVYINACDRAQASMMFDESARMVRQSPELKSRLEVVDSRKTIAYPARNGVIRANSAEAPNKDGLNPLAALFDELHRQPTRELWEVFEYAGAARDEPIIGSITTAGESEEGVWFEQREYSERVNRGEIPDTTHLGVIYRAAADDDMDDPATWRKANPSLGVTIRQDDFARELAEAKDSPVKLANFRRLRLNIVARESGLFLSPEAWAACGGPAPDGADVRGKPCYMGLDLSSINDLTALVAVYGDPDDGFDVVCRFWLPEEDILKLERQHRVPYRVWAAQGHITLTPGPVVDYGFVRRAVNDLAAESDLRKLLIDRYGAQKIATELLEHDGLPLEFLGQGFVSLSAPTKELARLVAARKLRHGDHPVLRWNAANAVAETDAAGNIKLSKRKSRLKIDGMAALVNAIAAATSGDAGPGGSVYNERGLVLL